MTLLSSDIKLLQSERMNDYTEGGGSMTAHEVVNGQVGNVFDSISSVDYVAGNVSLRKVFAAVTTADTSTFYGANVIIAEPPEDPLVNVAMFSNGDFSDTRNSYKTYIETYDDTQKYFGIKALQSALSLGDRTITVDGLAINLVPTNTAITQFTDVSAGEHKQLLIPGSLVTKSVNESAAATWLLGEVVYEIAGITVAWGTYTAVYDYYPTNEIISGSIKQNLVLNTSLSTIPGAIGGHSTPIKGNINGISGEVRFEQDWFYNSSGVKYTTLNLTYTTATPTQCYPKNTLIHVDAGNLGLYYNSTIDANIPPGQLFISIGSLSLIADIHGTIIEQTASYTNAMSYGTYASGSGQLQLALPSAPSIGTSIKIQAFSPDNDSTQHAVFNITPVPFVGASLVVKVRRASDNSLVTLPDAAFTLVVDNATDVCTLDATVGFLQSSLSYSVQAATHTPIDPALLGIDSTNAANGGAYPIFKQGGLVVVHNTQTIAAATYTNSQTVSMGRPRTNAFTVRDSAGAIVPKAGIYTTNELAGSLTFTNVAGLSQPLTIEHRIEDMLLITGITQAGVITTSLPVSHDFPTTGTYVSSALLIGNMSARLIAPFDQQTWTGVWSDALIGNATLANYNNTLYPIQVNNLGTQQDRWAILFQTATTFIVIGELSGVIAVGNINEDCAPLNHSTNAPFFLIDYRGWGAGWSAGYVMRFNTIAANYPIDLVRSIQQGEPTVMTDNFKLIVRGNAE